MDHLQHWIMERVDGDGGAKELLDAQAHVWKYTHNYITSMSLKCAVELGIPDIISNHNKPLTLSELALALSIPHEKTTHLYRLMRMLVHCGFFALEKTLQDQEEGYALTPSSRLLLKNGKTNNLSSLVLIGACTLFVTPFHSMSSWFTGTDPSPFAHIHGMDAWDYYGKNPDASTEFNTGMASDSKFVMRLVTTVHREIFNGFETLVDVGGGTGNATTAIADAFPSMRCTVLDLPRVVSSAKGSKNVEFVGGDMFQSVPSADIILLKWILHDWGDDECVKILKKCREALSKDVKGKVIIIDIVVDENKEKYETTESQLCFDMLMMVVFTGKERTETEWKKLFLDAGFTSHKITHGVGLRSIIEVFP